MICPHCSASIKYKERNYNFCSQCHKQFAFEPKTHPLLLTDIFFQKTVNKLSNNDKLYFTQHQLQFALSRKKLKSKASIVGLFVLAIITIIAIGFIHYPFVLLAVPFWIIVIFAKRAYAKKNISLPQTTFEFQDTVLDRWKSVYKEYPPKFITRNSISNNFVNDLKGALICEDSEIAMCLSENHLPGTLQLAIVATPKMIAELPQKAGNLPIYVLHDASVDGYLFLEKIKEQFGKQRQVIDIGFRPQAVIKSNLPKLREKGISVDNVNGLTSEEIAWLKKGYYTPLFVLRPEKLIQYVTKQIEQKSKKVTIDNSEKEAKAIGFMTWVGEK